MIKKTFILGAIIATLGLSSALANADGKPINFSSLPATARSLVQTHFKGIKVVGTTVDKDLLSKSFEVYLENGTKIEFDSKGQWKEIESQSGTVPTNLLPNSIRGYLQRTYSGQGVKKIERQRRGYEVELISGLELKFNAQGQLIGIDD